MATKKKKTPKRMVIVRLMCRHVRDFPWEYRPELDETVYCYRCHMHRHIVSIEDEYVVLCQNCRFTRRQGQARLNSEITASKHHRAHPEHEIELWHGKEVVHTWKAQVQKLFTEPLQSKEGEVPPF